MVIAQWNNMNKEDISIVNHTQYRYMNEKRTIKIPANAKEFL